MQKITMPMEASKNFLEVFEMFITSQTAKGVADITIRNYRYNMKNYFDAEVYLKPLFYTCVKVC